MPQILVCPTGQICPRLEVRLQSVVKLADIRRDKLRGSAQLYAGKFDRELVTNGLTVKQNQHKPQKNETKGSELDEKLVLGLRAAIYIVGHRLHHRNADSQRDHQLRPRLRGGDDETRLLATIFRGRAAGTCPAGHHSPDSAFCRIMTSSSVPMVAAAPISRLSHAARRFSALTVK